MVKLTARFCMWLKSLLLPVKYFPIRQIIIFINNINTRYMYVLVFIHFGFLLVYNWNNCL